MNINEVIENLEEQDLVTNPTIRTQGSQKQNSKVNSEPDTDDQSVWGHVKKYYKKFRDPQKDYWDRVKHAPRAKPQTSFIQGAKNTFSWPKDGFSKEQLKNIEAYKKYGDGTKAQKLRFAKAGGRDQYYGEGAKK